MAGINQFFESVTNFFGGGDSIPWSTPDVVLVRIPPPLLIALLFILRFIVINRQQRIISALSSYFVHGFSIFLVKNRSFFNFLFIFENVNSV